MVTFTDSTGCSKEIPKSIMDTIYSLHLQGFNRYQIATTVKSDISREIIQRVVARKDKEREGNARKIAQVARKTRIQLNWAKACRHHRAV